MPKPNSNKFQQNAKIHLNSFETMKTQTCSSWYPKTELHSFSNNDRKIIIIIKNKKLNSCASTSSRVSLCLLHPFDREYFDRQAKARGDGHDQKRTPKKAIPLKAIPINWWIDGERSIGGSPYNCSIWRVWSLNSLDWRREKL